MFLGICLLQHVHYFRFAYGQTGSGKTFTLFGPENDPNLFRPTPLVPDSAGIVPRAIRYHGLPQNLCKKWLLSPIPLHRDVFVLLASKRSSESDGKAEYTVFASFLQVYNENVYDLLKDPDEADALTIHETVEEGVFVEGLTEYVIANAGDCLPIVAKGQANRYSFRFVLVYLPFAVGSVELGVCANSAIRSTYMNQHSSRSHAMLVIQLERSHPEEGVTRSKLNLVDLAGSEKWNHDIHMDKEHIAEMTNINLRCQWGCASTPASPEFCCHSVLSCDSLHTLSRCINALSKANGGQAGHVPYRESKLTRLLKDR